jgi:hypothetical protein
MKQVFPKENLSAKKGNYAVFFACSKKDGDFTDHGEPTNKIKSNVSILMNL